MDYVKTSDAWITSNNAAGLSNLSVESISDAGVFFKKGNGKFANYYQSDNYYTLGAQTESYYRFDNDIVFYGKVGYDSFKGKNMAGSVFMDPYNTPFDIVEYTENTAGEKKLETYHLIGAVSVDITGKFTIGGKIDYKAANYSKHKDLRHKNSLMDMSLSLGGRYNISAGMGFGANFFYRRSTEGLIFDTYGNKADQYISLVSYGAFYGKTELFESKGYTSKGEDTPLFNEYIGGSFQVDLEISEGLRLFNELTYKSRTGYYGKRSPSTVVYAEHDGSILEYHGVISLRKQKNLHALSVNVSNEELKNYENVYRHEVAPGGNQVVMYYGNTEMLKRSIFSVVADYTANLGISNNTPSWVMKAGADYSSRNQTVSIYPYYRKQTINQYSAYTSACKNIVKGTNIYSLSLGLLYGAGGGTDKDDGIYNNSSATTSPASMNNMLYKEFEYLTASRIAGDVGIGYSRPINENIKGYAILNYNLTNAFDISYNAGKTFNLINIKIGCTF